MKVYIAARFSRRSEANKLANMLMAKGYEITSRWVLPECDHVMPTGLSSQAEDSERRRYAREGLEDIGACDWMISLTDEPRNNGRGGKHVEFGYALGLGKSLTIIGPRETVSHTLYTVDHFSTMENFMESLES